ncbi:MAG: transcription initiation factor IIB [Candidatus Hadarchaeota archaeon]
MPEEGAKREGRNKCPSCGSTRLVRDYDRAELVCAGCGLVIHDKIMDIGPEWRAFDQEQRDKRGRTGAPMTLTIHDKGLSTMIDWRDRDAHGKDLTPKRRAQIYRLRKWQRRIRVSDATERNLAFALSEIDRMSSHLALPRNIREAASLIYRKAVEERLIRGRSIEGVAAAALYAACRESKIPRTLDEIADVSRVSKKEIGRSYRFIARELLIHLRPTSPIDYIPRFGSDLKLSGEAQSKAIELLNEAQKKGLTSGRGPTGVAAAAIYIASVLTGERRTQRDVADVARVTEVTVRNRYKELCDKLGLDVEL